jgi:predicted DNA-binding transcriptional regulator AlpA
MAIEYLGVAEVATLSGLSVNTIKAYAKTGSMPEPDATISGVRGWTIETINRWIRDREDASRRLR